MAQKSLLKAIVSYIPSLLGERGVAVLSLIVFTRLFSTEEYGRFALALSIILMAEAMFMQWLRLSYLRFHAIALKDGHVDRLNTTTFAIVGLIIISISTLSYSILAFLPLDIEMRQVLMAAVFYFAANLPFRIVTSCARASERALAYGVMDVGRALAGFLFALFMINYFAIDERALLYGPAIAFAVTSLWGAMFLKMPFAKSYSTDLARNMFRYGVPLIGVFILMQIMSITDRLCLQYFIGSAAVGFYAVGFNLANNSMMMLFNAINTGAFPLLVNKFENGDADSVKRAFTEKSEILLAIALPATVGLSLGASNIAHIMIGKDFVEGAIMIMPFIAIVALCNGLKLFLFDQVFHLHQKSKRQLLTLIPPVTLNVALNIALIPMLGLKGAVIATLASSVIGLLMSATLSRAYIQFDLPYIAFAKIIFASSAMGMVLYFVPFPLTINGMIVMIITAGIVYSILCFAMNVLNSRNIILRILKSRKI